LDRRQARDAAMAKVPLLAQAVLVLMGLSIEKVQRLPRK